MSLTHLKLTERKREKKLGAASCVFPQNSFFFLLRVFYFNLKNKAASIREVTDKAFLAP